ncbi:hypothetical protein CMI47_08175 [Candidatus Pacearchaeota archaeon]|nr:hypothetical protein [Candidatus Pacearchaeota archaeon]|tara:strand:- start:1155 stop:2345 length:1191 start_codon:yes stop_codon:yes gene_type:complete
MKIVISSKITGTDRHLLCDDDNGFVWISSIPDSVWSVGDNTRSKDIMSVIAALGDNLTLFDTDSQKNMWSTLRPGCENKVPWAHAISCNQFKNHVIRIKKKAFEIIDKISDSYYDDVFISNRKVLSGMKRAKINRKIFSDMCDDSNVSSSLLKFKPRCDEMSQVVVYDQSKSVTGRLTIKSGPNILTLKRGNRSIFTSRYTGGELFQIDFVSLEPRIALDVAKKSAPYDIYDDISKNVFGGKLSRDESKISTICCLYGMTSRNLSLKLPAIRDTDRIISLIRSYFKIGDLERNLKSFYDQYGFIENLYGRKIMSSSSHVNHYLQSTGVDVSLLGFGRLLDDCERMDVNLSPIFVIHDALIVDAPPESHNSLKKIVSLGIKIRGISQRFPVKIEKFV